MVTFGACRQVNRGESNFTFPEFKSKAANAKHVCTWLADVLYKHGHDTDAAALMWGLADVLHCMHTWERPWVCDADACRLERSGRVALLAYSALAKNACDDGLPLFCLKPKHHQFDHLLMLVKRTGLNPSYHWAFCDEDQRRFGVRGGGWVEWAGGEAEQQAAKFVCV